MARAEAKYRITAQDDTERGLRSASGRLRRFGAGVASIASRIAAPFTVAVAAVGGLAAGLRKLTSGFDETAKAARDFGIEASELQELRVTADLLGTDLQTLLRIQERFATSAREAANGTKEYADTFKALGINAEAFLQLDFRSQLAAADIALSAQPRGQQIALRRELAGRRTGRVFTGELRDTLDIARDIVDPALLNEAASAAERFNDALRLLGEVGEARFRQGVTAPIAQAAGSEVVLNSIRILTDAIRTDQRRARPVTFTDESLNKLAQAVRQPATLQ